MSYKKYRHHYDDKLPAEILEYTIDWTNQLESGEDIVTSTWTLPEGITSPAQAETTSAATVWLSGGTANKSYKLTNVIETTHTSPVTRTYGAYLTITVY